MTYDEIINTVRDSDPINDWYRVDKLSRRVTVYKPDVNLRFEVDHDEESGLGLAFFAEWATEFPDERAYGVNHYLWYGASLVRRFLLVSVDGGRASLPIPHSAQDLKVSRLDYVVAAIHDSGETLDEYMREAGLTEM